jgi:hypothetical protein
MHRCGEIGIRNRLKIAVFAISLHFKIDQIERNSPGEIAQIREFRLRIGGEQKAAHSCTRVRRICYSERGPLWSYHLILM